MSAANELVDIIRDIIKQEMKGMDQTVLCKVSAKKDANHYDVYLMSDEKTTIHNVANMTKFDLEVGDYVYVYKVGNQLNTSFVCYKLIPYAN